MQMMMMRITKPLVSNLRSKHLTILRNCQLYRPVSSLASSSLASHSTADPSSSLSSLLLQYNHNEQLRWSSTSNGGNTNSEGDATAEPPAEEATATEETTAAAEDTSTESSKEDKEEESTEDEVVEPVPESPPASAALHHEIRVLKDQLRRSLADQENTRNIARRDVQKAREFAIKSFAKSLLDVADNLQRALDAVPPEYRPADKADTATTTETEHPMQTTFMKLYEGIAMTEQGLQKAFANNGLVPFGQVGEPFDPSKHEALLDYDDPALPHHSVGMLMKRGYTLHDLVLRPAEVGVVVHKTTDPAPSDAAASDPAP